MPEELDANASDSPQASANALTEPRWPAFAAFVTTWLCPAKSARRTQRVTLPSAFVIHFASAILAFLLILWLTALDDRKTVAYELALILGELPRDWLGKIVVTGLLVLMIEGAFPVLAFLVMPWGAGDEPLRSSWKHALRVTWLHSTHALPLVLIVGAVVLLYCILERNYYDTHPSPRHTAPSITSTPAARPKPATPEAMREYKRLVDRQSRAWNESWAQHRRAVDAWEKRKPFLLKNGQAMVMWLIAASVGWILWALLRAVGAERRLTPAVHPPTCEFCGYNLTGARADGRCPECGHAVADSLGPEARPGTLWERRRELGRLQAWWRCNINAIRRPSTIGRQIRVSAHVTDHRVFLAMHLPASFIIGAGVAIGMLFALFFSMPGRTFGQQEYEILQIFIPLGGTIGVLIVLAMTTLGAGIIGLIYSLKNRRNLLPAAMQVASYLSGFATIWACFAGVVIPCLFAAMIDRNSILGAWAWRVSMDRGVLMLVCCSMLNLPWLAVYLMALWRGTGAAQHANR